MKLFDLQQNKKYIEKKYDDDFYNNYNNFQDNINYNQDNQTSKFNFNYK